MSTYFVTGATGSIGRRLVAEMLRRPASERVFALVRSQSADKLDRHDKSAVVLGDLEPPIDADRVDHVVHLAAVHDLTASADAHRAVNVDGTRRVVGYAGRAGCGLPHHVSSIAVAGDHRDAFAEDDFDLGRDLPSPYHATEHATEKIVREQGTPSRVYRPGAVAGDSRTGEVDKVGGSSDSRALDASSRVAAGETVADGVTCTSVRMPLVRTPAIGPTKVYDAFPAATPQRAAQWVVRALERRPEEPDLLPGALVELARRTAPEHVRSLMHLAYRAMPEKGTPRTSLPAAAAGVTRLVLRATR